MLLKNIKKMCSVKRQKTVEIVTFCLLLVLGPFFVFCRFKYNFLFPNFYAEDGKMFSRQIYDSGFTSFFKLFNGYYILGLYALTWLAERLNHFLGFNLADLPRTISVVSYVFYSFVFNFHWLLLNRMSFAAKLLLSLMLFTVPLAPGQYEIFGIIGNTKWVFAYIAFLLVCWRASLAEEDQKNWLAVLLILICFYTLPTVIFLYPILFLDSMPLFRNFSRRKISPNVKLSSFLALCVLSIFQVWATLFNDHSIKGYLDGMLNRTALIEIVVARTFLYGFSPQFYTKLNDFSAIVATSLFFLLGLRTLRGSCRWYFVFGFLFCFILSAAFVLNRPGISQAPHFNNYTHGSYSRFFFAQNMICFLLFVGVFDSAVGTIHNRLKRLCIFGTLGLCVLGTFFSAKGEWKYSNFMEETIGNIYLHASKMCSDSAENFLLPIYPTSDWQMASNKKELCSKVRWE